MRYQLAQAWLENRDLTTAKLCDAVSINIHADDLMTHIRQTRTCHEPYISGTKDTNLHNQPALKRSAASLPHLFCNSDDTQNSAQYIDLGLTLLLLYNALQHTHFAAIAGATYHAR